MRALSPLVVFVSLLIFGAAAHAQERATEWSSSHPFALGVRTSVRGGDYVEGGVGGHIRLRPMRWFALEAFMDNFAGPMNGLLRHDHEVGTNLQLTVLGGPRWNVYPLLGACAMLVMVEPSQPGAPEATDVRFGVHVGAGGEFQVYRGFSLQAQLEGVGYVGHDLQVYRWSANVSPDAHFSAVAQMVVGANYYF